MKLLARLTFFATRGCSVFLVHVMHYSIILTAFVIILMSKRELTDLISLSSSCLVTVTKLRAVRLFHMVPWAVLQCMIVIFPADTFYCANIYFRKRSFKIIWKNETLNLVKAGFFSSSFSIFLKVFFLLSYYSQS